MPIATPLKLTLVTHGITPSQRESRFPIDEPLVDVESQICFPSSDFLFTAPELRARQMVREPRAAIDEQLRDLDCGRWAGMSLDEVDQSELVDWLSDPDFAGHGGESVTQLIARVSRWLENCAAGSGRTVAVTHPAVVRAAIVTALRAPREMFWRIDVGPQTQTRLRYRNGWTVRIGEPLQPRS